MDPNTIHTRTEWSRTEWPVCCPFGISEIIFKLAMHLATVTYMGLLASKFLCNFYYWCKWEFLELRFTRSFPALVVTSIELECCDCLVSCPSLSFGVGKLGYFLWYKTSLACEPTQEWDCRSPSQMVMELNHVILVCWVFVQWNFTRVQKDPGKVSGWNNRSLKETGSIIIQNCPVNARSNETEIVSFVILDC